MSEPVTRVFVDDHCPNCLAPLPDDLDRLFDSEACQQVASTIRYLRRTSADGRFEREDVRAAVRRRMWFALNGGYPAKARRIPAATRSLVFARDHGLCRACGEPGDQIDHIGGDSNDLNNLQVLCVDCHNAKTDQTLFGALSLAVDFADQAPATGDVPDEAEAELDPAAVALLDRAAAPVPIRLCDDETWESIWLELWIARRQRIVEHLEASGVDMVEIRRLPKADRSAAIEDALVGDQFERVTEDDDGGYGPDSYFARSMQRDD